MLSKASLLLRMRLECSIHDAQGKRIKRFEDEGVLQQYSSLLIICLSIHIVRPGTQVLNEIHLHRGIHPHLTVIDTFVDGQHLTEAIVSCIPGMIVAPR